MMVKTEPKTTALAHVQQVRRDLAKMVDVAAIKEVADKSETLARYYRKSIKDIRAANACAEAVLWAWVRMGEIVNGQIGGKGRPKKCVTGDTFIANIATALSVSRRTVTRYQLAARMNEQANFDAHLSEYRDDEVGRNLALMTFLADIRRLLRREDNPPLPPPSDDWKVTSSQKVIHCDALITDPPYGILDEPWEPAELRSFTTEWAKRWNNCGADIIIIFWSQANLGQGQRWFDDSLTNYRFTQLLVWHYPNNKKPSSRKMFKRTWEPVLFYRRQDSGKDIFVRSNEWGNGLTSFDCHVAAVPQSNFKDADLKRHPAQKPVSVMRWLINASTDPDDMVCDPFCGSGTTGIAARQLGRKFHGIERDKEFRDMARRRIGKYGTGTDGHASGADNPRSGQRE